MTQHLIESRESPTKHLKQYQPIRNMEKSFRSRKYFQIHFAKSVLSQNQNKAKTTWGKKTTNKHMSSDTNIILINWIQQYTRGIMHFLSLAAATKDCSKAVSGIGYLTYTTQIITEGSQERNSNRKLGGTLLPGSLTDPSSANCPVQSRCTCLGMLPHTDSWASSYQSARPPHISHQSRHFITSIAICQSALGNASIEIRSSQVNLDCVMLTLKTNQGIHHYCI